jgi:hypothetical protein
MVSLLEYGVFLTSAGIMPSVLFFNALIYMDLFLVGFGGGCDEPHNL